MRLLATRALSWDSWQWLLLLLLLFLLLLMLLVCLLAIPFAGMAFSFFLSLSLSRFDVLVAVLPNAWTLTTRRMDFVVRVLSPLDSLILSLSFSNSAFSLSPILAHADRPPPSSSSWSSPLQQFQAGKQTGRQYGNGASFNSTHPTEEHTDTELNSRTVKLGRRFLLVVVFPQSDTDTDTADDEKEQTLVLDTSASQNITATVEHHHHHIGHHHHHHQSGHLLLKYSSSKFSIFLSLFFVPLRFCFMWFECKGSSVCFYNFIAS